MEMTCPLEISSQNPVFYFYANSSDLDMFVTNSMENHHFLRVLEKGKTLKFPLIHNCFLWLDAKYIAEIASNNNLAHSTGAVEYTDCFSIK